MKPGGGKRKGSAFERQICKELSLWWSGQTREDCFWRTASSGGRSTSRGKQGKTTANSAGDICSTDERGAPFLKLFAVEIKSGYNKFSVQDVLDAPPSAAHQTYTKWVDQARKSRDMSSAKYWMVILKRDKRVPLVMAPSAVRHELPGLKRLDHIDTQDVILFRLADFLAVASPPALAELLSEKKER